MQVEDEHEPPIGLIVDLEDDFEEIDYQAVEHSVEEMWKIARTNRLLYEQVELVKGEQSQVQVLVASLLQQDSKELSAFYAETVCDNSYALTDRHHTIQTQEKETQP